ncbi:MAG: metallophosphoesterase family protein [Bacteroidetes bacterium]|nr:metallophosphoesterase family protein [Bacteroidota bacterium]
MKILLISDNHAWHDQAILHHAAEADEVWHAGDWLNLDLFHELEKSGKPVRSCWGNVDGQEIRRIFPLHNRFELMGIRFWMTHIGGYPGKYNPKIMPALKNHPPDVFICGHSHILKIVRDPALKNMLCLNPGSCGMQGFHLVRTAIRFTISPAGLTDMAVIEFGKRVLP